MPAEQTTRRTVLGGLAAFACTGSSIGREPDFEAWATPHARPIRMATAGDLAPAGWRVLALGEPMHGAEEPLALRNAVVSDLLARDRLDAVALETGVVEARFLSTYVLGGSGDARDVVRRRMTWGFGRFRANVQLLELLRNHNAQAARPIDIHGIDVPGGDQNDGLAGASVVLDTSIAALPQRDPLRTELTRLRHLLDPAHYVRATSADKLAVRAAIAATRRRLANAPLNEMHSQAVSDLATAKVLLRLLAAWPDAIQVRKPSAFAPVLALRDEFMAGRVSALAAGECRVLVYAHLGHCMTSPAATDPGQPPPPASMGTHLRRRLGDGLHVVGITAGNADPALGRNGEPGTLDRMLARVGSPPYVLDLKHAPSGWPDRVQTIRTNVDTPLPVRPRTAFDAVAALPRLTAAAID